MSIALPLTPDGLVYEVDPETGEILSVQTERPFVVESDDHADWVLARFLQVDAQIASVESSEIVQQARAIIAAAEAKLAELRRRRLALELRFSAELGAFARQALGGSKSKTWKSIFGSVSLRSSPARLKVSDKAAAGWWAISSCPESARVSIDLAHVRAEDVPALTEILRRCDDAAPECLVSMIPAPVRSEVLSGQVPAPRGFELIPEREVVSIKTEVPS